MLNTPLKTGVGIDNDLIYDRDGKLLAECNNAEIARAIVQMVNATAAGG